MKCQYGRYTVVENGVEKEVPFSMEILDNPTLRVHGPTHLVRSLLEVDYKTGNTKTTVEAIPLKNMTMA